MTIPPSLAQPSVSQAPLDEIEVDLIKFDTTANETVGEGELAWNDTDGTLDLGMKGGNVTQQIGMEQFIRAKHASNSGLTKGVVYYLSGSSGGNKEVLPAQADSAATCKTTIGVATKTVTGGTKGFITTFGLVRGLPDSQFTNVTEGTVVYLSATTPGAFTSTPPAAPNHRVVVGFCVRKQSNNNELFVKVQTGYDVDELCDVDASTPASGDVLTYDGSVWKNEIPSTPGGAARPLLTDGAYLDGSNGLVLSGLASNYASTPDSAALSITGDIDIRVRVKRPAWNVGTALAYLAKYSSSSLPGNFSYRLANGFVSNAGDIQLAWSENGTNEVSARSSVSPSTVFSANETGWIRATLDVDNGSGVWEVKFYTAPDSATMPTSWNQLGTTQNGVATTNIFDGNADLLVGSRAAGQLMPGTFYRVQIRDGIDGTVAFDADFSAQTADALAFTEASTNAATVTINTTRYLYGLPNVNVSGTATGSLNSGVDLFMHFFVTKAVTVDMAQFEVTTGPASNANVFVALYAADDNLQPTGAPIFDTGAVAVNTSQTGIFRRQITPVTLQPGIYLIGINSSVNMTLRRTLFANSSVPTSMGNNTVSVWSKVRANGAFPSSATWDAYGTGVAAMYSNVVLRWKAA